MSTTTRSTTSNNQTQSTQPWGPIQQPLERSINEVSRLVGNTEAFRPHFEGPEKAAWNGYVNAAQYARDMNNGGQDYFTPLHTVTQIAPLFEGAHHDVQTGGGVLTDYAENAGQVDIGARGQQWQDWQENFLGDSNPYLDQVIDNGMEDLRGQLNAQFTGAGRSYGSGAYANAAADRLGRYATQLRYDDYNNRYNQERSAFQTAQQNADQYGYGAANQLYGGGLNTVMQGSQVMDRAESQRIADIERVNMNRMMIAKQLFDDQYGLSQQLHKQPQLKVASWPLQQLMNPGSAFSSTVGGQTLTRSQPNNQFWPGVATSAFGLFGGFG